MYKSIVITGASGGIGSSLALAFASDGVHLLLTARSIERLDEIASACRQKGAQVTTAGVDVRDKNEMASLLQWFDHKAPIDLLIANAGVSCGLGPEQTAEYLEDAERLIDINMKGTLFTTSPLLDAMRKRGSGHIALVSSLAGFRAHPDLPTYSATKAGIAAYGSALRGWLSPFGVDVSVIYPGFVTSPMSQRHEGPKPFEISAEQAACIIRKGLLKKRSIIAFPAPLLIGMWLQRSFLLPKVADLFLAPMRAKVADDPRYAKERQLEDMEL